MRDKYSQIILTVEEESLIEWEDIFDIKMAKQTKGNQKSSI